MTIFRTLENIKTEELLEVFNLSFSDYFVPIRMSVEQMKTKFDSENIALNYSVGAFYDNQLVGFILHFYKNESNIEQVYNGGTGVLKNFRGNRLTQKMYDFIIPKLKNDNVLIINLEVLIQNTQAIKSYKKVGFEETRELLCFKGNPILKGVNSKINIDQLRNYDWEKLTTFWNIYPTWQNSISTVNNLKNDVISLGAYQDLELVGYIIFNEKVNRILQIAIDKNHRNIGIGKRLIQEIVKNNQNSISIVNIDNSHKETIFFFENIGLIHNVSQIELQKAL